MQKGLSEQKNECSVSVLPIVADKACVTGAEGQPLLKDIELKIAGSGRLVVLGPNGAGKSLLLRLLTGLIAPSRGTVSWCGRRTLNAKRHRIGFVFQKPILFRRTVAENLTFALRQAGLASNAVAERTEAVLKEDDLSHLAEAPARRLSGGEQQRVAIARARAIDPEILFLDEPTAHLDPASTAIIEDMISKAAERGTRIVHVTHDLGQAKRLADEIVFLHKGTIVEHAMASTFFANPESEAGRAFVSGELVI